jgi:hypothetical protein
VSIPTSSHHTPPWSCPHHSALTSHFPLPTSHSPPTSKKLVTRRRVSKAVSSSLLSLSLSSSCSSCFPLHSPSSSDTHRWLKNQLVRFVLFASPSPSCFCRLPMTGSVGPSAFEPPPPRSGLAMRDPTPPPNAKDAPALPDPERPRVDPALAASRRSLTAVSWDSKLSCVSTGYFILTHTPPHPSTYRWFAAVSFS